MHHHPQQEAERIYEQMPLPTVNLLARIIPPEPPFSVVFTDWLR
jgi:hypothetical protein